MRGKHVVLALLGALLLATAAIFWVGLHGGSTHTAPSAPGVKFGR